MEHPISRISRRRSHDAEMLEDESMESEFFNPYKK
jgi:hypothetical protein